MAYEAGGIEGKDMTDTISGGCACGRIRYEATVRDEDAYLCHCKMCQRASGNVSLALKGFEQADVRWNQGPDWYRSSAIAHRPFCSACGTSLGFRYDMDTTKMDLTVGSFDDPYRFKPSSHFASESVNEPWINTSGLPRHRSDNYQRLVDRWHAAGETPPE